MQITATNFRKGMFQVFERAKQGEEVLVSHRGEQFRLVLEKPVSKLSRLRPIPYIPMDWAKADEEQMKKETWAEIEAEWDELYGKAPVDDRLPDTPIVAYARANGVAALIPADEHIRANYSAAHLVGE